MNILFLGNPYINAKVNLECRPAQPSLFTFIFHCIKHLQTLTGKALVCILRVEGAGGFGRNVSFEYFSMKIM